MKKIILLASALILTFSVSVFAQPFTIKDLADVQTKMEQTDGQFLQWESSSGLWKPVDVAESTAYTAGRSLTLTGSEFAADAELYTDTRCAVVESLAAADDDFEIMFWNFPVTITAIGLHCRGTCTTGADISLEDRAGNAMTHTVPTHSTGSSNTVSQAVTASNALVAGEGLAFDVDNAVDPETDIYTICATFTKDD